MNKYILVIDDSPTVRTSVEFSVRPLGLPVLHAENGLDALEKVKTIKEAGDDLAICVCDINMPQMDGMTFINELRKSDKFTPIVVLTTETDDSKIQKGKTAGVSGWIVKPFRPDQLVAVVERFVKK
jgi:two-component system, chemotaxis family, chemotaxis protein CheY